jgi:hypothetical protein
MSKYRRRNRISGQWSARLIEMLESPAYRALSLSAHRLISRIEIELANHGGNDNGRLPVTKQDFIDYGISSPRLVASAIREAEALGFIRVTQRGRGGNAEHRQPNHFLLTFAHGRDSRAEAPRHDWRRIKTIEEAEAIAVGARNAKDASAVASGRRNWRVRKIENRYHKVEPKPVPQSGTETTKFPVPQSGTTGSGEKVVPLSISRGGGGGSGGVCEKVQQAPGQPEPDESNGGDTGRGKIPWTTPWLVEIEVTPEERATLERSPGFVVPGDVALIAEDRQGWLAPPAARRAYKGDMA